MLECDFKFISSSTLSEDCNIKSEKKLSPRLSLSVNNPSFGSSVLSYKQFDSASLPVCINRQSIGLGPIPTQILSPDKKINLQLPN